MTIQLKTNSSASAAAFHLARNTQNLQKSLNRLASGSRIIQPADDTGGLAVSMKLQSSISRLEGASIMPRMESLSSKCRTGFFPLRVGSWIA